ncbi:MAG TPA: DUF294 nucleotidyltransferase-like domain-containing protein, partial [Myxococcota bacterium]|nr:DUF294 nucleotidyltransferase-like domain-containing protein [Myxococcota bacterium]
MNGAPTVDEFLGEAERPGGREAAVADGAIVAAVRAYLGAVRQYLEQVHRRGVGGQAVNEANSDATDRLVRRLFRVAEADYYAAGAAFGEKLALVAVGGYARREMSIHSDIDLLFLHPAKLTPYTENITQRLQRWLWDAGLTLGCATRTTQDTLALAREDVTVRTAILDARFLVGDVELFHEFSDAILEQLLGDKEAFLAERMQALRARHAKYGESIYLLQPNVKEGAGGLRDFHTAYWATRAAHPSTRGLDDLLHFGLLTEREMEEFRGALQFLWRVRNELHLISKRKNDQMSFDLQERLANSFGYSERTEGGESFEGQGGPDRDELPVERFMGDYYRHARAIQSSSEIVIEQCMARVRRGSPKLVAREVDEGFRVAADRLEIPHAAHLRERPLRLLTAFTVAQNEDVELSRTARRLVRENLDLVDEQFRSMPVASTLFLQILESDKRVMRTLRSMNEVGLLGSLLPEWEHIVCRWQHVIYHTYTVDVHSLFLVQELRRLERRKHETSLPELTELMRATTDHAVLYLGCLLHDVGKGLGGDHSNHGAVRARTCVERLGLAPERAERVVFLVRHHLLM